MPREYSPGLLLLSNPTSSHTSDKMQIRFCGHHQDEEVVALKTHSAPHLQKEPWTVKCRQYLVEVEPVLLYELAAL